MSAPVADVYFLWTDSEFSYKPWRTRLAAKLQVRRVSPHTQLLRTSVAD